MTTILIDRDIEGQAERLWETLATDGWLALVDLRRVTFAMVGLPVNSPDRVVWRYAQTHGMYLLTNNRNSKGRDSLGQTLSDEATAASLPVLTIGNAKRLADPDYRTRCAARLAEVTLYPALYLGAGRIFIP